MSTPNISRNWFDAGGRGYAQFRPEYPAALADYLAEIAPRRGKAVDAGCGTGQLTVQLARHFTEVIGLDPSADQLENAAPHADVSYLCAPAEALPVPDHSADLITAAQAAHWFDLPAFYAEARRIAAPDAVIALISYGVLRFENPTLNQRFARFYRDEAGPYWPAERRLVDSGYADLDFPFAPFSPPALVIERDWNLAEFLGYVSTWSAVRRMTEAGRADLLTEVAQNFADLWGDAEQRHRVSWPINLRVGRI
ncbi:class I SAM-dependent methyltransferase [Paracoccus aminophilus]|uniref:Methyltransferase type 11 n=2 Tax=Paracoccus aminophilus TaxID=34003 RepID=S5YZG2_PARAH|nr:class I SAM-dependent methyltransferase [Paracoccus aminophilus]ACY78314.1 putative methyltransferase type 11 [Paracoccus aminophilus]AGT10596.1 methyltransferase type 11 [Paracoccus aminophilus JCM 7686]